MRLLLLNCFSRNALAVLNSISEEYDIIGAASNVSFSNKKRVVFKSRRITTVVHVEDPIENERGFCDDIVRVAKEHGINAIIATGTVHTDYLSKYKHEIFKRSGAVSLVEDFEKLSVVTDKWGIFELCQTLGINAPKTALLNDPENIRESAEKEGITIPFVIKPRRSFGSKGVHFITSYKELENRYLTSDIGPNECIIQEMISGELHDVTSCSKSGKILSILSQERLLTWHDFGGGGIINRTTKTPETIESATKILKHLAWNGIAEFDFIKNEKDQFFLVECNPKIWGTTQLTIESGLNMPQQLIDSQYFNMDIPNEPEYEIGLVYKWLFPECLAHLINRPLSFKRFLVRLRKVLKHYPGSRTLHNLEKRNLKHLLGIVLNKSIL